MKFQLLLFVLYKKLTKAAKQNMRFIKFIEGKQLKFAIKSNQNGKGRLYVFNNGKIMSTSNGLNESAASMVWSDPITAFKIMSCGNDEASVAAMTDGSLKIEGNFKEFMWFSRALDIMMGKA